MSKYECLEFIDPDILTTSDCDSAYLKLNMRAYSKRAWSEYKRREYDVTFVKSTGSPKMAVKLRLLASIL